MASSQEKLFAAIIKQVKDDVSKNLDWEKVAEEAGYKDANNARTMFSRFKKKLTEDTGDRSSGEGVAGAVDKQSVTKKRASKPKSAATDGDNTTPAPANKGKSAASTKNGNRAAKRTMKSEPIVEEDDEEQVKQEDAEEGELVGSETTKGKADHAENSSAVHEDGAAEGEELA